MRSLTHTHLFLAVFLFILLFAIPISGLAQDDSLGDIQETGIVSCEGPDCHFEDLMRTAQRLITWVLYAAISLAMMLFAYAGILYITSGGNSGQVEKAHAIFRSVIFGFIIALAAWIIVYTITSALINEDAGINTLLEEPK